MRLAHFSDVHLSVSPFSQPLRRLIGKRITGCANHYLGRRRRFFGGAGHRLRRLFEDLERQRIDHAVCTGDITGMSYEVEFARFADAIREHPWLAARLTTVPGNHDRYTPRAATDARFEAATQDIAPVIGTDPRPLSLPGGVTLIAMDVCRPGGLFDSSGLCGMARLRRLSQILTHPTLENEYVVVALHYPPKTPPHLRLRPRLSLRDASRLTEALEHPDAHVDLVLHGHVHTPFLCAEARPVVACSGSATDLSVDCGYNIYGIDARAHEMWIERRVWSRERDAYVSARQGSSERYPARHRIRLGSRTIV